MDTKSAVRPIWHSVIVPSFIYTTGAGAIVPALVLTGTTLGMSATAIAALVTWLGVCAVLGSLLGGISVSRWGERNALLVATLGGNAALAVMVVWHLCHWPGGIPVFAVALTVVELADGIWSLARQKIVAEEVPPAGRAVAMTIYAGAQRSGRVVGPLLTAIFVAMGATELAYLLHIVAAFAAMVMVERNTHPSDRRPSTANTPVATSYRLSRHDIRAFWLLGIGIVAVSVVRTDRDLLVPLWGVQHLHLHGSTIALVLGLCSAIELLLFYPSGVALNRFGRGPVATVCLATLGLGFVVMAAEGGLTGFIIGAILLGVGSGSGAGIMKVLGADLAPEQIRARYLGWWNALSNTGNVIAPGITALVLLAAPLAAAVAAAGAIGVAGAAWMRVWLPRFIPNPSRAATRSHQDSSS